MEDKKTVKCVGCKYMECTHTIVAKKGGAKLFNELYCPISGERTMYKEIEDGDQLKPRDRDVRIRSSGVMHVVETVIDYGHGFKRSKDPKYFYDRSAAEDERGRRLRE